MAYTPGAASTRAVVRLVDPGSDAICCHCGRQIKFAARTHPRQVIANIYVEGSWQRVEHYHEECYTEAGQPLGAVGDLPA